MLLERVGDDDLALGVDLADAGQQLELDALLLEDRRRHLGDALDGERAVDGREERHLGLVAQAALAQLRLDQEGHLERRGRALVRDARRCR